MNLGKNRVRVGITLAEMMLTISIIGVIAVLVLPPVISHNKQQETANKLKKFYANINQAVRLSEIENGKCSTWRYPASKENDSVLAFYKQYFAKYTKAVDIKRQNVSTAAGTSKRDVIKLADGSAFWMSYSSSIDDRLAVFYFYPNADKITNINAKRDVFLFELYKSKCFVEPYTLNWKNTRADLKSSSNKYGCNSKPTSKKNTKYYCAKLIEYDGWQISKDYPW